MHVRDPHPRLHRLHTHGSFVERSVCGAGYAGHCGDAKEVEGLVTTCIVADQPYADIPIPSNTSTYSTRNSRQTRILGPPFQDDVNEHT